MVYKSARYEPSVEEQQEIDNKTQAGSLYNDIYYGTFSRLGNGYTKPNKLLPQPSYADTIAMPMVIFGVLLFFLVK